MSNNDVRFEYPTFTNIAKCKNPTITDEQAEAILSTMFGFPLTEVMLRNRRCPVAIIFVDTKDAQDLLEQQSRSGSEFTINAAGPECEEACQKIKEILER